MKVFQANITIRVSDFLNDSLKEITSFEWANQKIVDLFGIKHFFDNDEELKELKAVLSDTHDRVEECDRTEYGDFQTNSDLANQVILHLLLENVSPEVIVEPTCGKGNFIIAALKNLTKIQNIFAVEIHKPYVWEAKFNVIDFFLENPASKKPEISIIHCNVFDYDFKNMAKNFSTQNILVIGNPPWVTNSMLGALNSANLPKKTNFKNHRGLDAITGKGNFDIAESITMTMIAAFQNMKGHLLFLVKSSVIKNIIFDQNKNRFKIASIKKYCIDSKKEFNVSVEAALFYCKLQSEPEYSCEEFNFDTKNDLQKNKRNPEKQRIRFGWLTDKFVSNIDSYTYTKEIDGVCPFVWRQGLKHDCSAVMELDRVNGHYINGLKEEIKLEEGLVYGILKSSDLKDIIINQTRKFTIVTQKRVGQETGYIKTAYPKTYQYLTQHQANFEARKSNIYNNKPLFSIFGVGDYSFKPYKVAISGLYKTFQFTLILPQDNKPIMLDDTCYLIGFDKIEFAAYTLILLNSQIAVQFLQSVTFADAKRTFTKDVLMRIDLLELVKHVSKEYLQAEIEIVNEKFKLNLTLNLWSNFTNEMAPADNRQMVLFD